MSAIEIGDAYDVDELLGDEYFVGDDMDDGDWDEEIVGGPRRRRRRRRRRRKAAMASRAAALALSRAGTIVKSGPPQQSRKLVMGFDSGAAGVAAGAAAAITSNPQKTFRPERISVASAIANNFLLNSLQIGTNNQLISAAGVPCDTFSSLAVATVMKMDTAQINQAVIKNVTNLSGGALRFLSALIGTTVS